MTHPLKQTEAMQFMVAGKATVTLKSLKTEKHFTYKIMAPHDQSKEKSNVLFVKLLNGPDNTSSYVYIGFLAKRDGNWVYIHNSKAKVGGDAPSVKAFSYVFEKLVKQEEIPSLEIWHEGKCCRCGRKLTDPLSVQLGIGPECRSIKSSFVS